MASRSVWITGISLALAFATGCGPTLYAANVGPASRALERARHADAPMLAPYEYYYADAFLQKAREDAGEAAYQDAIAYARIAEESAEAARERARASMRETGR